MRKLLLITLFCSFLISVTADNDKIYLFSIRYKSNGTNAMAKSDLESVKFNNKPIINYNFTGDPQSGVSIIFDNTNNTIDSIRQDLSGDKFNISLTFKNYQVTMDVNVSNVATNELLSDFQSLNATLEVPTTTPKPTVQGSTTTGSTKKTTTTKSTTLTTASSTTTTSTSTTTPPKNLDFIPIEITVDYMKMHVQVDNSTVNKNTGAIVVAVIEALLLVGIVVFILYRNFSAASKRRTANAGGGWPGSDTNDVTYRNQAFYDQPYQDRPVTYRVDTETVRTTQPASSGRINESAQNQPARNHGASGVRVQTSTPTLMPTSASRPVTTTPAGYNPNRDPFTDPWNAQVTGNQARVQNSDPFDLLN